jgi:hypothetical protein
MIKFPCKCGNIFNLTDDMAGGMLQCPRCGLLNDIPTLNDLPNLSEDGTVKLAERSASSEVHDQHAIAQMHVAFSPHTTDHLGRQKDLRPDEEHFQAIGESNEEPTRAIPKYDPATGELVRALDLKSSEPMPVLPATDDAPPLAAIPVQPIQPARSISYATYGTHAAVTPATLLLELFQPANAVVMLFLFIFYLIAGTFGTMLAIGSLFFHISLQVLNVFLWLIIAHYGCVIEDTALEARDELPRPLRNLDLNQDIISPFINVVVAGLICYFPAIIAGIPRIPLDDHTRLLLVLLFGFVGSFFFPAVVLTTITGSTLQNLRPDRVLAVMLRCGGDYILAVGVYLVWLLPTAFYLIAETATWMDPTIAARLQKPLVCIPALAVCVYLTHYFCWLLGLMYRSHHEQFPWVLQHHISMRHQTNLSVPPRRL